MKPEDIHNKRIISPEGLFEAYSEGYFPMADSADADAEIYWHTAYTRGILPIDKFHISSRSLRYFRKYRFTFAVNTAFDRVIDGCAKRAETWINPVIRDTFSYLHQTGEAHSIEVFKDGQLAGGLYGLAMGGAFFAESVFQNHDEGHKAALWYCREVLNYNGFLLWDTQFPTSHLEKFGCLSVPRRQYMRILKKALQKECTFLDIPQNRKPGFK
ncbi:MAG: leucyl/phenylalanyl-tRNA--protein transferase [Balneolales bacterium]|nr:leucyl/phenylalanyl-tRNA--protein transferase [Balneolales bacterium]